MEKSRALNSLQEAADLTQMIEQFLGTASGERVNSILPGIQLTLRDIREVVIKSHAVLAREFLEELKGKDTTPGKAHQTSETSPVASANGEENNNHALGNGLQHDALFRSVGTSTVQRNLRAAIERRIERG